MVPVSPVTVRMKVVEAVNTPVEIGVPEVTLPTPPLIDPEPLAKTGLRVVEPFFVMGFLATVKVVMAG